MNRFTYITLIASSFCSVTVGQENPISLVGNDVAFVPLDVANIVTCFDVSDNGTQLVLAHEGDNQLSIYDILNKQIVTTINAPSPRTVIWRGGYLIVANEVDGEILVFDEGKNWQQTTQLRMPRPGLKHISAPRG